MFATRNPVVAVAFAALAAIASISSAQMPLTDSPTSDQVVTVDSDALRAEFNRAAASFENGQYADGVQAFPRLAKAGYVPAMFAAGVMFGDGKGVAADNVMALRWFVQAARANHASATCNAGMVYRDGGHGVTVDPVLAAKFIWRGAMLDDASAQRALGAMYYNGAPSVEKNVVEAWAWSRLAVFHGDKFAKQNVDIMRQAIPHDVMLKCMDREIELADEVKAFVAQPTALDDEMAAPAKGKARASTKTSAPRTIETTNAATF